MWTDQTYVLNTGLLDAMRDGYRDFQWAHGTGAQSEIHAGPTVIKAVWDSHHHYGLLPTDLQPKFKGRPVVLDETLPADVFVFVKVS